MISGLVNLKSTSLELVTPGRKNFLINVSVLENTYILIGTKNKIKN
jgi:hypothetical protein